LAAGGLLDLGRDLVAVVVRVEEQDDRDRRNEHDADQPGQDDEQYLERASHERLTSLGRTTGYQIGLRNVRRRSPVGARHAGDRPRTRTQRPVPTEAPIGMVPVARMAGSNGADREPGRLAWRAATPCRGSGRRSGSGW